MVTQYQSKYSIYSIPSVNKASLKVRDNIMKVLSDKNYTFGIGYNDLYILKSGKTVRRLKGGFTTELSEAMFIDMKQLVESCSTNEFKCELNCVGKYFNYIDPSIFIIKIENK